MSRIKRRSQQLRITMNDTPVKEERVATRLGWLMVSRVAIVSFLLGVATFIEIMGGDLRDKGQ